ncbi:unnamed protein product, partial [Closterium sp. NIES-53]
MCLLLLYLAASVLAASLPCCFCSCCFSTLLLLFLLLLYHAASVLAASLPCCFCSFCFSTLLLLFFLLLYLCCFCSCCFSSILILCPAAFDDLLHVKSARQTEDERVTKERRRLGLIGPNDEPIPKSKLKGKAKNVRVPSKRPDLVALKVMTEKGLLQKTRTVGAIPGVRVGDRFFARAEMVVVGLHRHWLNGIDIIPQAESPYDKSIAVAVVVSGGYEDDEDEASRIWYTGQGGNDLLGSRKQVANQVLRSGNLALM